MIDHVRGNRERTQGGTNDQADAGFEAKSVVIECGVGAHAIASICGP